jgi:hypothetical protein
MMMPNGYQIHYDQVRLQMGVGVVTTLKYVLNGRPACSRVPWAATLGEMIQWTERNRKRADE